MPKENECEGTWVQCLQLTSPCLGAVEACAASEEELSQWCLYLGGVLISGMQENRDHLKYTAADVCLVHRTSCAGWELRPIKSRVLLQGGQISRLKEKV